MVTDVHEGSTGLDLDLKAVIEGALFAVGKPLSIKQLQALFSEEAHPWKILCQQDPWRLLFMTTEFFLVQSAPFF